MTDIEDYKRAYAPKYQSLFVYLGNEFGVSLLESQLQEVTDMCNESLILGIREALRSVGLAGMGNLEKLAYLCNTLQKLIESNTSEVK